MLRLLLALLVGVFLFVPRLGAGMERSVLWHVVQACIVDHNLTGSSFPCLDVETDGGLEKGYAVVRAPFDKSHTIVTPTVPTIGIEAERLRGANAPNYFADAWLARRFAVEGLVRAPDRGDLALAVNSRLGRSQDQLHIHVDCIRPTVKRALQQTAAILPGRWTRISVLPQAPRYWATALSSADLEGINVFDLVARGLHIEPKAMHETTIVVVGAGNVDGKPGFVILARQRIRHSTDEAHGEALMDHSCPAFR